MVYRGTFTLSRLNAHRAVLAAAALTTLVAAALATTLVVFSGQALPRSVRQDLTTASGTSLVINGPVTSADAEGYTADLHADLTRALAGAPSAFYHAYWSDPLGLPVTGGKNIPIAEAATLGDVTSHAHLLTGAWPAATAPSGPIPAALPASAAALLHVSPGDVLRLRDRVTKNEVSFLVTGLFQATRGVYWNLNQIAASGSSALGGFVTYGPLVVNPAVLPGRLAIFEGSWVDQPDTPAIPLGNFRTVAARVSALRQTVSNSPAIVGLTLDTNLDSVLTGTATSLGVSRSLLAITAVELFLLAGAALVAVAQLLAAQREGEYAILAARGATRLQLTRMAMAEAVPLCLIAGVGGAAAGVWLAGRIAARATGTLAGAWWAPTAVAASAAIILIAPAALAPTPGAARIRRGRQTAASAATRAGTDVAVLVLAVLAGWQLRRYSAVSAGPNGSTGIDPVLALAPALALAGGTIAALRILPAAGKAGDWLAARGRRLTTALASWQVSRQPLRQGGTVLLIVLAVATSTLALAQHQSWLRSNRDQAAFAAGADVRADLSQPLPIAQDGRLARVPEVLGATPVAIADSATNAGSPLVALDPGRAAQIALLRPDQSPLPLGALFRKIQPGGTRPGVVLKAQADVVRLTAALGPARLRLSPATVLITIDDADGNAYQLTAGTLPGDGRPHTLAARVAGAGSQTIYPLRVTSITVDYALPTAPAKAAATFRVLSVNSAAGNALSGWRAGTSSDELTQLSEAYGAPNGSYGFPAILSSRPGGGASWTTTFDAGWGSAGVFGLEYAPAGPIEGELGLAAPSPLAAGPIPGIATQAFLAANSASVGDTVSATVGADAALSVRIVAVVSTFPTVTSPYGAVIVDLPSIQDYLASQSLAPLPVTQWWLATAGYRVPPGLQAALPPGSSVTSVLQLAAGLAANPMSAVPQQALLAIAIAAAVLAVTGCCVAIAVGIRQRRAENALLAALGVAPGGAARQLCLERLMLGLPSALAGLVLGAVIAELLVPAVTLTVSASLPVPPVIIAFDWAQTLPLALAVAALPVLVASAVIARRPDPAAELRTAEAA
ncbi:MAG TPA: FtsX-like permease family protein [Streptosporangiaceae bacterium]|nr:FtsX-like permease family protein [Streptosporangiaceae bacterium]